MKLQRTHTLDQQQALERIKALCLYWDTRYGTSTQWTGNQARIKGKVRGIKFDGTFSVDAHQVGAQVKVGFLAERIGGRSYVERKLTDYLDPRRSLEELLGRV